jgi:hypothetical protein
VSLLFLGFAWMIVIAASNTAAKPLRDLMRGRDDEPFCHDAGRHGAIRQPTGRWLVDHFGASFPYFDSCSSKPLEDNSYIVNAATNMIHAKTCFPGIPGVNRKSLELFVPCTILATAYHWADAGTSCGVIWRY